jgi:hypothetical protein
MPALAVTQPYIPKRTTDLIDTNTDPGFNNLQSAYAALAQAQQALVKQQNRPAKGELGAGDEPGDGKNYFLPKNISDTAAFKTNIDAALAGVKAAIVALQLVLVDANPQVGE